MVPPAWENLEEAMCMAIDELHQTYPVSIGVTPDIIVKRWKH
jgi:hypothetical protein